MGSPRASLCPYGFLCLVNPKRFPWEPRVTKQSIINREINKGGGNIRYLPYDPSFDNMHFFGVGKADYHEANTNILCKRDGKEIGLRCSVTLSFLHFLNQLLKCSWPAIFSFFPPIRQCTLGSFSFFFLNLSIRENNMLHCPYQ